MPGTTNKSHFISAEKANDWFATELSLYHCEFNRELYNDHLFANLAIKLPESLNKAVVKRRAEFLAGRYCAAKSLQQWGINNGTLEVGKHRNPLWPESIIGSISHCGSQAVAITGRRDQALGVGIDIEEEIASETVEKIQRQILSEEEIALIAQHSAKKTLLFTLAFSLKESFFKAAYPTVAEYFDFDAVSLVAINWQERTMSLRIDTTLHEKLNRGMLIQGSFQLLPDNTIVTLIILNH